MAGWVSCTGLNCVAHMLVVMHGAGALHNLRQLRALAQARRHIALQTKTMVAVQFTYQEMVQRVEETYGPLQRCADPRGEVAKNFTLPGFAGSVSFISSMTEHFCSDCNRLRLMADGNLKVCLFGSSEVSLRDAMREGASDEQLRRIISAAVTRKRFAHANMDVLAATQNRAMIKIGG